MLDKRGNSNQEERKLLIIRYIRLFGLDSIDCIIADREFIGQQCGVARAIRISYQ